MNLRLADNTRPHRRWTRGFSYDTWGNSWVDTTRTTGISPAGNMPTSNVYNGKNQNGGASYDAAGNQTVVNGNGWTYDAENRGVWINDPVAGSTEQIIYDGLGQRVRESWSTGGVRTFVHDIFGNLAAEYSPDAVAASPCQTCYLSADLLGSTRLVTDEKGNVVGRHDYLPYGEEIVLGRGSQWGPDVDPVRQKFTGQQRDTETGVDYFQARYYGSTLERFTSTDPANAGADASSPQSWNGYAYVGNNPLVNVDPTGMGVWDYLTSFWDHLTGGGSFGSGFCESFSGGGNCGSGGGGGNWGYQEWVPFYNTSPFPGGGGGGGAGGSSHPAQPVPTVSTQPGQNLQPAKNGTKPCANGAGSGGIGVGGGYNLDLGAGSVEASSTGGVGAGASHNRAGGFTSGYSGGGFLSGGGTAFAGWHVVGAPAQSSNTVFALGAYAGAGANVFATNAASVQQLSGPFTTVSVNVGFEIANIGLQVSFGGGIWSASVTPPIASFGFGAAASVITTNTVTTHTGCN